MRTMYDKVLTYVYNCWYGVRCHKKTDIERIVKERMTLQDSETLTPLNLLNTKPLVASLKEFLTYIS